MPKSEGDVLFEFFFDNPTTEIILEVLKFGSFNIFRVYLTIMFILLQQI